VTEEKQNKAQKPSAKARKTAARLLASQAVYQSSLNEQPLKDVAKEYLDHRIGMEVDGEELVAANKELFSRILTGIAENKSDIGHVVQANLKIDGKRTEPLIKAILMCAAYELFACHDTDKGIIINDYLNVAHAFFDQKEVNLMNGILDAVAKALRDN
tara:strand:+ start:42639 stop:43112 length:474 start_codon:yes stop_codon:yes gene_type:complete